MNTTPQRPINIALGGMALMAFTMAFSRFSYTPMLPYMVEALHFTKSQGGTLASANYLGYLVGAIVLSKGSVPGDRRVWVLAATVVGAIATAAMALTTSFSVFVALRFVAGVASAADMVFGTALVLDGLARAGRANLMWMHFAGVGVGLAISAAVVPLMGALGFDWAWQWAAFGVLSLIALLLFAWLVPGSSTLYPVIPAPAKGSMSRQLLELIIAYGLYGFGYVITVTFISTMLAADPVLRPISAWAFLILGLAAVPSVALGTWVGGKIGFDVAFAGACMLEAVGTILSIAGTNPYVLLSGALLVGGTFNGLGAIGLINARSLTIGDARRNLGLMSVAVGTGQIVGPIFAGFVWQQTGSFVMPSVAAAIFLALAGALALMHRWRKRSIIL